MDSKTPFWIEKVLRTSSNAQGVVSSLSVLWYESRNENTAVTARYGPLHKNCKQRKLGCPQQDTIQTDTVIASFARLRNHSRIPATVQQVLLREVLSRGSVDGSLDHESS